VHTLAFVGRELFIHFTNRHALPLTLLMDGLSEDSTLLSAVLVADFIDRVAERWLYSLITASTAWLYHFLTGNHDVWLTLGFVAWKHSAAAILLRFVGLNQLYLITVIAVVT
jgi:hypothetical protein